MKKNNPKNHSPPLLAPPEPPEKVAEKLYPNSETSKEKIISENTNKSGIYK